jgi:hypothetical protein
MKIADYLPWFEGLVQRFNNIKRFTFRDYSSHTIYYYQDEDAQTWASEAGSALAAVFPSGHHCRQTWDRLVVKMIPENEHGESLEQMLGVIRAATQQLKDGRIGSILDAARVETEDELLDQALGLLQSNYLAAAAVIAGGALEAHLRHLVAKSGLSITGDGTISKYDAAIAKARNDGTAAVYAATDSKLVTGWGGIRNDAAHDPGAFSRSVDDIRRMIEGIREFISRTYS